MRITPFARAYIKAALWENKSLDGCTLAELYTINDLADESLKKILDICKEYDTLAGIDKEEAGLDCYFDNPITLKLKNGKIYA